jgi:hypothetical protein
MTPERMARLVARCLRLYTRSLPAPIAQRRREEVDAVLDQIEHQRADGTSDRRITLSILSRAVRGLAADAAWREHQAKLAVRGAPGRTRMNTARALRRSAARVALGVAIILSLPLVGMLVSDGVVWTPVDFAAAGILLTVIGVAFELALRRSGGRATAIGVAVLGVAAALLGEADDAPGLVLLGILLFVSAVAIAVRVAQHTR